MQEKERKKKEKEKMTKRAVKADSKRMVLVNSIH